MKKEGGNEQRNRLIALLAALLFHAAVFFFMFYDRLTAVAPDEIEPKPMTTDISFGGEYVALGDIPEPDHTGEAAPKSASEEVQDAPAEETENSGPEGEGTSLVSTNKESKMQTPKKKNGPTKEELAKREEEARAKREREARQNERRRISSRTNNAFGKSGSGRGQSGSPSGNATRGALAGQPGHTLGVGYTIASWGRPRSGYDGEIRIRVRVNAQGNVIHAEYAGGKGAAAADPQVRQSCVRASRQSRFSVPRNASGEKVGVIIWRFE